MSEVQQPAPPPTAPGPAPGDHAVVAEAEAELEELGVTERQRQIVLWLNNINHAMNHFQNQMLGVMYPAIARDLGFGPMELGVLSSARNVFGSWVQLIYGFLTPFVERFKLLGIASLIYALGTFSSGLSWNFLSFLGIRCVAAAGSTAQHPLGYSLLASYFKKNRATVQALNTTASQVGSMLAPLAAGALLLAIGWRQTFYAVAILSVLMALAYFFFNDSVRDRNSGAASKGARLAKSRASYFRVLRNRNFLLVALVFLAGGAGRGELLPAYVPLHLEEDLGLPATVTVAALFVLQLGGLVGPLALAWISDRTSRTGTLQVSLALSGLSTLWLAFQDANIALIAANMFVQGAATFSRGTLTQTIVADSVDEQDLDAAFSLYFFLGFFSAPIWALLAGWLFASHSFAAAFVAVASSYVMAMGLVFFVRDPRASGSPSSRGRGDDGQAP